MFYIHVHALIMTVSFPVDEELHDYLAQATKKQCWGGGGGLLKKLKSYQKSCCKAKEHHPQPRNAKQSLISTKIVDYL